MTLEAWHNTCSATLHCDCARHGDVFFFLIQVRAQIEIEDYW
jgi:hypothetical protein